MVRVRFAPSPTGYIHIGNARIALFNWLFAKKKNGIFVLRYDDTDTERSRQEYIDSIAEDLQWLGIEPEEIYYQSKRFERYGQITEQLKAAGLLYPCFETAQELELRRKIKLGQGLPPIYDRAALKLTEEQKAEYIKMGRSPHWRFLLPNFLDDPFRMKPTTVSWLDEVKGAQLIDLSSLSDPVLVREDGTYLYTLPSVIDDIDMEITHIIRGDDHVTNTAVQLAIFNALNAEVPIFGHINLLTTVNGDGLSKRKGDLSLRSLRETGFDPMAIASLAVLIGSSENVMAYSDMQQLGEHFSLTSTSKSAAKFDPEELTRLNSTIMHEKSYSEVQDKLEKIGVTGPKAEQFWQIIRHNIEKLTDIEYWWAVIEDKGLTFHDMVNSDKEFLNTAFELLPHEKIDENSWKKWTKIIANETGRAGKALFAPLRLALTGRSHGPELAKLLPFIEISTIKNRLVW
ncbi:MAG: glutamate--tRNA ligase [Alphaproteobacteria bacterium]|nr:glutamate--tRNA ligase [Alphaproteobacteria bacterium]